jgi:hypothetical protein
MSSVWVAAGTAVVSLGSGLLSSRKGKKQAAKARELQERQLRLMEQQMANFKKLTSAIPKETQKMIEDMNKSYAEVGVLLAEAKRNGDNQSIVLFEQQRALVKQHLNAELTTIGMNADEMTGLLDEMTESAVTLVREDAEFNDGLKAEYKKEADVAVGNLRKMAEASGQRMESILKTGLAPEAAAVISKMQQGVADLTRKTAALESKVGKGGAASRISATELEGLKMIGETTAELQQDAQQQLQNAGNAQSQFLAASGEVLANTQTTRGRDELAARSPYDQMQIQNQQQEGAQSLAAIGNANVATRNLTGAEGEASLAREDQFARDRMSLVQSQASGTQALREREQDLKFQGAAGQAGQARSMADIMGVQAQNYSNMAMQSSAAAQQSYSSAFKGLMGGSIGMGNGGGAQGFGQGFMQGAYGINMQGSNKPVGNQVNAPSANADLNKMFAE